MMNPNRSAKGMMARSANTNSTESDQPCLSAAIARNKKGMNTFSHGLHGRVEGENGTHCVVREVQIE